MNQNHLYTALNKAGFKILSFEDFPCSQGSWRVSFMKAGINCEVSCNRFDGCMSLNAKSAIFGTKKSVINSLKFLTDEAELFAVASWLRSLSTNFKSDSDKNKRCDQILT